jgi:hypothetical protein
MAQSYQCVSCKHFNIGWTCKAFPDGIPEEIYSGEFDHKKEFKNDEVNDNGVRYEKKKEWPEGLE